MGAVRMRVQTADKNTTTIHRQSTQIQLITDYYKASYILFFFFCFFLALLDLCASFLLACLFCKFWDCMLAVGDGCQFCVASICSSFCSNACCCDPSNLEDFIDFCTCCSCTEFMEACGCRCGENAFDCSICDLCLETTECLELGMELSQLLFH
uniref:Si:dkey-245f22.3 n=1 Tax=Cyprinus carpio TaxID=7962 RepID=A0A8C1YGU7_CYPCA